MAKIPKNLDDKAMFAGVKEEHTFETMFLEDEPQTKPKAKPKNKEKEDVATAFLTKELQEKIGRALLEMKLDLYKEGVVEYDVKVARQGWQITLTATPAKQKMKQ